MSRENLEVQLRTTLARMLEQSNAAPKVSKNKRVHDAQAFWEDDDEDGAKSGQRFSNVRKKSKPILQPMSRTVIRVLSWTT